MNCSKLLRPLTLMASVSVLFACGGGGGGDAPASRWPFRVTVEQFSQQPGQLRAAARASAVAVGDDGRGANLAFTSTGTPVVGYWVPTVIDQVGVRAGDLRAAAITGTAVEKTVLVASGSHIWSKLAIGTDDTLRFFYTPYGTATTTYDVAYYQGRLGVGATLVTHEPGDRGPVRALGVPVRSPSGAIVTPVVSNSATAPADLSLWSDGWASADRVTIESAIYGPVRLHWDTGTVPSVTFDLSGDPVVAYERNDVVYPQEGGVDSVDHTFVVARKSGGVWSSEDVFTVPWNTSVNVSQDCGPFVAVDSAGTVHMVVLVEDAVRYASKPAGGAWSSEVVPLDLSSRGTDLAFALDGDVPSILYTSASLGAALARRTGASWVTESIDKDNAAAQGSASLAVAPDGALWSVYNKVVGDVVTVMAARRDSDLPPTHLTGLATSGTRIVDRASGATVQLRGVSFTSGVWAWDPANPALGALPAVSYRQVEGDFQRVHGWGANVATLYINWFWFQTEEGWNWLDQTLEWARRADVYVVPSMVVYPNGEQRGGADFWSDATAQQQLRAFWAQFARRYRGRPEIAGADVLNEPGGVDDATIAAYETTLVDAVQAQDPNRLVFIESQWGNAAYLTPISRNGLVYVAHYYHPFSFTAEGFPWMEAGNVALTTRYPGTQVMGKTGISESSRTGITPGGTTGWTQVQTPSISVASGTVAFPVLFTAGEAGTVWFDGVEVSKNGGPWTAVPNGDMEMTDSAMHWVQQQTGAGAMARSSDQAHDGSWSARSQGCTGDCEWVMSDFWVGTEGLIPVAAGDQLRLRFWTRTQGAKAGSSGGAFYFANLRTEYWDKARLRASLSGQIPEDGATYFMDAFAQHYQVPLFVGEFAPSNLGPSPDVATYAGDVMEILNDLGISWTYYEYRGDYDDLVHNYMGIFEAMKGVTTPECAPPIGTGSAACIEQTGLRETLEAHLR